MARNLKPVEDFPGAPSDLDARHRRLLAQARQRVREYGFSAVVVVGQRRDRDIVTTMWSGEGKLTTYLGMLEMASEAIRRNILDGEE